MKAKNKTIEKRILEGLKDIEEGRCYGPFSTVQDMLNSLHDQCVPKKKADLKKRLKEGAIQRADRDLKIVQEWSALRVNGEICYPIKSQRS